MQSHQSAQSAFRWQQNILLINCCELMSKIKKFGRIYPRLIFPKRKKSVLSSLLQQKFKCHQCFKSPHGYRGCIYLYYFARK